MKKFVLVPSDKFERLQSGQNPENKSCPCNSSSEMSTEPEAEPEQSGGQENVTAEKKNYLGNEIERKINQTLQGPVAASLKRLSEEEIINALPKKVKGKASRLLNFLKKIPLLNWDGKGEVSFDENVSPYSHITDLVRDSILPYKNINLAGKKEWYDMLSKEVPLSLLHEKARKEITQRRENMQNVQNGGEQKIIPPPGIREEITWTSL